ncbi:leukotriene B4 receptor 1-like [Chiloscyllium plagiosum]|uniref:leukotriene B4 receptor 1-like n=1 Tax=Chiloscyllium plagiosum TaxID=36176 RepID=UPI001CB87DB6|nr:leukotriene B4 receptor 1-like [Chiloscyllium plagiosum]
MVLFNTTGGRNGTLQAMPVQNAVACAVLSLACLVGVPGNLVVIVTILGNIKQRSSTITLILSLAVADFVVLVTLPFWIYFLADSWIFGIRLWQLTVYLIFTSMYASVFFITALSVERLVAALYPFRIQAWWQRAAVRKVAACVWILALLLAVPSVAVELKLDENGRPYQRAYSSDRHQIGLFLLETLVGFLIPFITLSISYVSASQRIKQMVSQRRNRSVKLIAGIVLVFAICWFPYHTGNIVKISSLLVKSSNPELSQKLDKAYQSMKDASGALAFISSSINPILYAFAARNFKDGFKTSNFAKLFEQLNSFKERREKGMNDSERQSESRV